MYKFCTSIYIDFLSLYMDFIKKTEKLYTFDLNNHNSITPWRHILAEMQFRRHVHNNESITM